MEPEVMLKSALSFILVIGLLITLVIDPADGHYGMDTDLHSVNASFIGEDASDASGFSVAGAGDVNGDGYDDILVGAYHDSDGGSRAGQTYLILGNRTGWSMDTRLSKADASFIGEGIGDMSGRSVAGAGDVNGDGYDDIIIGAHFYDYGDIAEGRAYVYLGSEMGLSPTPDWNDEGEQFFANFGSSAK